MTLPPALCPVPGQPRLEYVPAVNTDIRKTFERARQRTPQIKTTRIVLKYPVKP